MPSGVQVSLLIVWRMDVMMPQSLQAALGGGDGDDGVFDGNCRFNAGGAAPPGGIAGGDCAGTHGAKHSASTAVAMAMPGTARSWVMASLGQGVEVEHRMQDRPRLSQAAEPALENRIDVTGPVHRDERAVHGQAKIGVVARNHQRV